MKKEQQRKEGESFPDWVARVLSHLSFKDKAIISEMMKAAWFDGLHFERDTQNDQISQLTEQLDAANIFCEGVEDAVTERALNWFCENFERFAKPHTLQKYVTFANELKQAMKQKKQ